MELAPFYTICDTNVSKIDYVDSFRTNLETVKRKIVAQYFY